MLDKKGNLLEIGQNVVVPDPNDSDLHYYSFVGIVIDVLENRESVMVKDNNLEFFEIEADKVVIND